MAKISPYKCYTQYIALKNHFSTTYNYFRYNQKTKHANVDTFEARADKYQFQKLARHRDPIRLMLANFSKNPHAWIGDLNSEEAERIYIDWLKRFDALTYTFKEELPALLPDFNSNFIVKKGQHPHLIKLYLSNKISLETFVIIVDLAKCYSNWNKHMGSDDTIWIEISTKYQKYKPFLPYDRSKFRQILLEYFKNTT